MASLPLIPAHPLNQIHALFDYVGREKRFGGVPHYKINSDKLDPKRTYMLVVPLTEEMVIGREVEFLKYNPYIPEKNAPFEVTPIPLNPPVFLYSFPVEGEESCKKIAATRFNFSSHHNGKIAIIPSNESRLKLLDDGKEKPEVSPSPSLNSERQLALFKKTEGFRLDIPASPNFICFEGVRNKTKEEIKQMEAAIEPAYVKMRAAKAKK